MSNFNNKDQAITPKKAFVCSMLYVIGADGQIDPHEIANLLSLAGAQNVEGSMHVEGEDKTFLREAIEFVKHTSHELFLDHVEQENILNKQQKLFILANMLDSVLGDGKLAQGEKDMVIEFQERFGISNTDFKPLYEVILFKNTKNLF
jgi:uncharacterized tellurite resistance protein B-like protein